MLNSYGSSELLRRFGWKLLNRLKTENGFLEPVDETVNMQTANVCFTKLKIGTRSVHVGRLREVSQDTSNYNCTLLSIVAMLNTLHERYFSGYAQPRLIAMLCLMYAKGLF